MKQGDITIQGQAVATNLLKAGNFNRDISVATGTQAITGLGFKPQRIILMVANDSYAFGNSIGISGWGCVAENPGLGADLVALSGFDINYRLTSANTYTGVVQSYDTDGFTISWTKSGTPTGNIGVIYMAFK